MFPKSLRGYVERALARCKDETQMVACQAIMKDVSLYFRCYPDQQLWNTNDEVKSYNLFDFFSVFL